MKRNRYRAAVCKYTTTNSSSIVRCPCRNEVWCVSLLFWARWGVLVEHIYSGGGGGGGAERVCGETFWRN